MTSYNTFFDLPPVGRALVRAALDAAPQRVTLPALPPVLVGH